MTIMVALASPIGLESHAYLNSMGENVQQSLSDKASLAHGGASAIVHRSTLRNVRIIAQLLEFQSAWKAGVRAAD